MGKIGKWQGTGVPGWSAADAGDAANGASRNLDGDHKLAAAANVTGVEGEASIMNNSSQETLQQCIHLVSLLAQFRISADRFSFARFPIARKYNVNDHEWGQFCASLLPDFSTCTLGKSFDAVIKSSQINLLNLAQQSEDRLLLPGVTGKGRSFKAWYGIIMDTIIDDTWMATNYLPPPPSNCLPQVSPVLTREVSSVGSKTTPTTHTSVATSTNVKTTNDQQTSTFIEQHSVGTCTGDVVNNESARSIDLTLHVKEGGTTDNVGKTLIRKKRANHSLSFPISSTIKCNETMSRPNSSGVIMLNVSNCSWCRKNGHLEGNCWRKLGLCLICGGRHKLRNCLKYVTRPGNFQPICPECNGPHLGMNCARINKGSSCAFCGKHGHSHAVCRYRLNQCLLCGDRGHKVKDCFKNVSKPEPLLLPPSCTR